MPYRRNSDLPDSIKVLPSRAQTIWRNIFNSVEADGASEESAFRQAWGGLKNQGWAKDPDSGKWRQVEKSTIEIPISKIDEDQNLVFGWANVSITKDGNVVTDTQDDEIDLADLETAAYTFMLNFSETGVDHEGEANGHVIESFVVTPEKLEKMGLESDALHLGWWLGFYVEDDETFAKVKRGDLSMLSIQGTAIREAA